jgi:hypothetical protein
MVSRVDFVLPLLDGKKNPVRMGFEKNMMELETLDM